ncbi:GntR family transcriptional regulator [Shivajiella indica]|uniref:GntR family transcriptional regulator n=1 Tax=Shivajiella indica TaxID=872115 RepID=A0ABW5B8Z6_9BACT
MKLDLIIDENSSIPKYIQIVKAIKSLIVADSLRYGDKIPSINNLSNEYYLSRDTVEKAYVILKKQGIIESVKGKGYYISHHSDLSKYRILLLFNKLSSYKKEIFNALIVALEDRGEISFHVHHCEYDLLKKIIEKQKEAFDYYVIMPHFKKDQEEKAVALLKTLPKEKLIFLDNKLEGIPCYGAVFQDFKSDIYEALNTLLPRLEKYMKLLMVFPSHSNYPYPEKILLGFKKFTVEVGVDFEVISEISEERKLEKGEAYIVIEENDLVNLIKKARETNGLEIGKNFGILSYNETPLKEVLQNGITVISTDFSAMGKTAAEMILNKKGNLVKNKFKVIVRASL